MTPLAKKILEECLAPPADDAKKKALLRMSDIHCFEITSIQPWIDNHPESYAARLAGRQVEGFLPAPKCWFEYMNDVTKDRSALVAIQDGDKIRLGNVNRTPEGQYSLSGLVTICIQDTPLTFVPMADLTQRGLFAFAVLVLMLKCVNTPRVIGRRVHQPHAGLAKRLLRSKQIVGTYPLNAWSEITIKAFDPKIESELEPQIRNITGRKCQHFVVAHLRKDRDGNRTIKVKEHRRGDPALGMKQTRYKVVLPRRMTEQAGAQA